MNKEDKLNDLLEIDNDYKQIVHLLCNYDSWLSLSDVAKKLEEKRDNLIKEICK